MIVGHKKQFDMLQKAAEANKLPHGLFFCGQAKIGKKKVALELAKLLFCSSDRKTPCNVCRNCVDLKKNAHPDFMVMGENENKEIKMDDVRNIIWKLSLKPYSASRKIAVIDNAHLMNRESQNAFLKTLEEPSKDTLLIMITDHSDALLSTISSRMQKVKFLPVSSSEIKNHLKGIGANEKEAELIAKLSGKRPGRAIELFNNKELIKEEEKLIENLNKLKDSDFAYRFKYAKILTDELAENENFKIKEVLDAWLNYFRNALFDKVGGRVSDNKHTNYSANKIKNIITLIQKTNFLLTTTNVNTRLALELLFIEM